MEIWINAVAARNSGGLTFLRALIEEFATDSQNAYRVFVRPDIKDLISVPAGTSSVIITSPPTLGRSVLRRLWWEQISLPQLRGETRPTVLLSVSNIACFLWRGRQAVLIQSIAPFERQAQQHKGFIAPFRYAALTLLSRMSLRSADRIIVNSMHSLRVVVRNGCPAEKVSVIPLGRTEVFRHHSADRSEAQAAREPGYLLTVGDIWPHKNQEMLIRALGELKRRGHTWPLRIVGGIASERYYQRLKSLVAELNIESLVSWLGFVPYDELPGIYGGAGVFVLVSITENFPHTFLEAMSVGCPVVGSRQIPTAEICGEAALECNAADAWDIADKIEAAMQDRQLRTRMSQAGLRRANELDWRTIWPQYHRVFCELETMRSA